MSNYLVLSRQSLYDMVWTRPMTQLAQDFGISDVALAKRCKAVDVPVPPRGYWARVTASQKPPRTPLPKYRGASIEPLKPAPDRRAHPREVIRPGNEPEVRFGLPTERPSARTSIAAPPDMPEPAIKPTTDLAAALPVVRRLAKHLKLPGRGDIRLAATERDGPLPHVEVSVDTLERALKFLDTLLRAADALGWALVEPEPETPPDRSRVGYGHEPPPAKPRHAELLVDEESIGFHIEERYRTERREPTQAEQRRMKKEYGYKPSLSTSVPTGRLRFIRHSAPWPAHVDGKTWYDQGSRGIETKIPQILAELRATAAEVHAKRLKHEEERRQQAERERLAKELAARRAANINLVAELERQTGAWHRAQYLRCYLRAARRTTGNGTIEVSLQGRNIDFLAWADHYINQLDPLHAEPHDPNLIPDRPRYGSQKELLEAELTRFSGHAWDSAWQLTAPPAAIEVPDDEIDDGDWE